MNKLSFVASVILIIAASTGCAVRPRCDSQQCNADSKITAEVKETLRQHPDLNAPDLITVQTRDGVVYLTGMVSTSLQSQTAVSLVAGLPNVAQVVNSMSVSK